jgi:hypothetical protein
MYSYEFTSYLVRTIQRVSKEITSSGDADDVLFPTFRTLCIPISPYFYLIVTSARSNARRGPSPFLRPLESPPNQNTRSQDLDSRLLRLAFPFVGCMRHFPVQR